MRARDVMTPYVVSVKPEDTVAELAEVLLNHGISGAPVIDGETLVGIVTEGDLIRRPELGTADRPRSWWLRLFTGNPTLAGEYAKSHATRVRDVMVTQVLTVAEDTPLAEIAGMLEGKRIKRVPVVRNGRVLGIVSRANLVQRLAAQRAAPLPEAEPDDTAIREQVLEALRHQWWANTAAISVTVTGGLVELWGIYRTEEERDAGRVAAERVPGVDRVEDHRAQTTAPYGYV